jgi:hypothetical protein
MVAYSYVQEMGHEQSDHNKQLIKIAMITLRKFHCTYGFMG